MRLENELSQAKHDAENYEKKFNRCIELTKRMLIAKCEHDKREARRKSMEDYLRLGRWSSDNRSYRNYNVRKLSISKKSENF